MPITIDVSKSLPKSLESFQVHIPEVYTEISMPFPSIWLILSLQITFTSTPKEENAATWQFSLSAIDLELTEPVEQDISYGIQCYEVK